MNLSSARSHQQDEIGPTARSCIDYCVAMILCAATRLISGATIRLAAWDVSTRARIYFANHSSHLDALVIWSSLPAQWRKRTRPAAARDYWERTPIRRYLAIDVFHAVLIARSNRATGDSPSGSCSRSDTLAAIDDIVAAINGGFSVIFFPEGTRGTGASVSPFKSGLYYIAQRLPGTDLVPVYLENLNRILPKGEFLPIPLLGNISFGCPIALREGEGKREFLDRARKAIEGLRQEICNHG